MGVDLMSKTLCECAGDGHKPDCAFWKSLAPNHPEPTAGEVLERMKAPVDIMFRESTGQLLAARVEAVLALPTAEEDPNVQWALGWDACLDEVLRLLNGEAKP
jgi:hypothetical protein